jgi:hypothetical protein
VHAVQFRLEFQHGVPLRYDLAHVAEALVAQDLQRRGQVSDGDRFAALRRMDDGRVENNLVGKDPVEAGEVPPADDIVPGGQGVDQYDPEM